MRYMLTLGGVNELYLYGPTHFELFIPSIIEMVFNVDHPITSDEVATCIVYSPTLSELMARPNQYNGEMATTTDDEAELYNATVMLAESLSVIRYLPVGQPLINKQIQSAQFVAPGCLAVVL